MTPQEFCNYLAAGIVCQSLWPGVVKREPVAYFYPSVVLPDIETVWTDKVTYPYAYLVRVEVEEDGDSTHLYYLYLSNTRGYKNNDMNVCYIPTGSNVATYSLADGTSEYVHQGTEESTEVFTILIAPSDLIGESNVWECKWCSVDICDEDGTTVYLAASAPISAGNGMVAYKGERLPDINAMWTDELKKTYPYALMVKLDNGLISEEFAGQYVYGVCLLSEAPIGYGNVKNGLTKFNGGVFGAQDYNRASFYYCAFQESADFIGIPVGEFAELEFIDSVSFTPVGGVFGDLVWTNYTIQHGDKTDGVVALDGTVYLAATDPIPIYE